METDSEKEPILNHGNKAKVLTTFYLFKNFLVNGPTRALHLQHLINSSSVGSHMIGSQGALLARLLRMISRLV